MKIELRKEQLQNFEFPLYITVSQIILTKITISPTQYLQER